MQALRETSRVFLEAGAHAQDIASQLAEGLANLIGGGCIIRGPVDRPDGRPLGCGHVQPASLEALRPTLEASPHALACACSAQAARSAQTILLPEVSSEVLRLWTEPSAWSYLQRHEIRSVMVTPVRSARRLLATIVAWREHPCEPLTQAHASLLDEVARRVAPALRSRRRARPPDYERETLLSIQQ